jgi:Undecaprenyl-phosphate glucose phosphotransferase
VAFESEFIRPLNRDERAPAPPAAPSNIRSPRVAEPPRFTGQVIPARIAGRVAPRAEPHLHYHATGGPVLVVDALVIVVASLVAGIAYHGIAFGAAGKVHVFLATGFLTALVYNAVIRVPERNALLKLSTGFARGRAAFLAWNIAFATLLVLAFALKAGAELSRGAVLAFFVIGAIAVTLSHVQAPIWLTRAKRTGAFATREIILVGAAGDATLDRLAAELRLGICPEPAIVTFDPACSGRQWPAERRTLCSRVTELARARGPGEIFISAAHVPSERLHSVINALALLPRPVLVMPDAATAALLRHPIVPVGEGLALQVQQEPLNAAQRAVKRAMDIAGALAAFACLAPFLLLIALAIRIDSPGPVLFRQSRNGYQGRPFRIFKFRTMTVLEDGPTIVQAQKGDVRVTRLGRLLRKTSLDELPQLFNVLLGHMSLVGPRPHARAHDDYYARSIENYDVRQHVKPGITGWAQVNGWRGETSDLKSMNTRIEHDLWYAKHASLLLDIRILARTVLVVALQRQAW